MHMLQIYSRTVILLLARIFMQEVHPEPHIRLYSKGTIGWEWRYHSMHLNVSAEMLNVCSHCYLPVFPNVYQNCFHELLLNFCLQHYAKNQTSGCRLHSERIFIALWCIIHTDVTLWTLIRIPNSITLRFKKQTLNKTRSLVTKIKLIQRGKLSSNMNVPPLNSIYILKRW